MVQNHNWKEIFQPGTQLRLHEGGRIAANDVYEDPQTIEITEVSEVTDKDGEWPQALTLKGAHKNHDEIKEVATDNIYVREGIERGDVSVV